MSSWLYTRKISVQIHTSMYMFTEEQHKTRYDVIKIRRSTSYLVWFSGLPHCSRYDNRLCRAAVYELPHYGFSIRSCTRKSTITPLLLQLLTCSWWLPFLTMRMANISGDRTDSHWLHSSAPCSLCEWSGLESTVLLDSTSVALVEPVGRISGTKSRSGRVVCQFSGFFLLAVTSIGACKMNFKSKFSFTLGSCQHWVCIYT